MRSWAKGGLIGFIVAFIGIWIILFITGTDQGGLKCVTLEGHNYCGFLTFIFSPLHIAFVIFFSWIGFLGGVIDSRIITKIIHRASISGSHATRMPLKITSTILITAILVFALIGLLAFENWGNTMVYAVIFTIAILLISWIVGKIKYG